MKCPNCQQTWPDEFKGCPNCLIPFSAEIDGGASGAVAKREDAQAVGERGIGARDLEGVAISGDNNSVAYIRVVA